MVACEKFWWTIRILVAADIFPTFIFGGRNLTAIRIGHIVEHESLAFAVAKNAAFAAHTFCDENSTHTRRPHHSSWMELHKFHIHQFGTSVVCKRMSIARAFPTIAGDFE